MGVWELDVGSFLNDTALFRQACYVDGQWITAKNGNSITVDNPATGETIGTVPKLGVQETRVAIAAADRALPRWRAKTAKERAVSLRRWYDLMPAPPCSTGRDRNDGSQKKMPQYANCTAAVSSVIRRVRRSSNGPKMIAKGFDAGLVGPAPRGGSFTFRRIQIANSAGSIPSANSHRHETTQGRVRLPGVRVPGPEMGRALRRLRSLELAGRGAANRRR